MNVLMYDDLEIVGIVRVHPGTVQLALSNGGAFRESLRCSEATLMDFGALSQIVELRFGYLKTYPDWQEHVREVVERSRVTSAPPVQTQAVTP